MRDEERTQVERREADEENISEERREFLKKCGRFAAYAAPAMVLVLAHKADAIPGSQDL